MGFEQSPHEAAIYRRGNGGNALLVGVYVDDLVITGTKDAEVVTFKEEMKATFQMSDLGPLSFYLGIEVHQDDSGITLRQTAYAKRIVELAGLTDCNPALTPMEERLKLSHHSTTEEVDATQYRRLVGSLRYLTHTRPDLAFSVGYVSRFMQRPITEHQQAVKRIIHYVAGTLDHGLYYPRCPGKEWSIKASYINTKDQLADLLTKPLGRINVQFAPAKSQAPLGGAFLNAFGAIVLGAPIGIKYWAATTYWSLLMSLFTVVLNVSAIWTAIFGAAMDYMISAPAHGAVIGAWLGAWPMPLDWERPWQEWPISVTYGSVAGHLIGMAISLALIVAHKRRGRAKAD
ncbi:Os10g0200800 [Oryza sativa Japonica Group]|uniref:Os10g0200800 protein n=1 Tax=Oryza sativa subsp. japonica TaxID=39947 RepID=Q0IYK0_ORYSJ|nr:Os10g0200800 [Oryza sativa Japonica Group]|eukprot:NP_001064301.2 Os10g0200800 [Oryza sativa Japonica Group]